MSANLDYVAISKKNIFFEKYLSKEKGIYTYIQIRATYILFSGLSRNLYFRHTVVIIFMCGRISRESRKLEFCGASDYPFRFFSRLFAHET